MVYYTINLSYYEHWTDKRKYLSVYLKLVWTKIRKKHNKKSQAHLKIFCQENNETLHAEPFLVHALSMEMLYSSKNATPMSWRIRI